MDNSVEWYYADAEEEQQGPCSVADLQNLFGKGVTIDSLMWMEDMENWTPLKDIPELFSTVVPKRKEKPPPPPPREKKPEPLTTAKPLNIEPKEARPQTGSSTSTDSFVVVSPLNSEEEAAISPPRSSPPPPPPKVALAPAPAPAPAPAHAPAHAPAPAPAPKKQHTYVNPGSQNQQEENELGLKTAGGRNKAGDEHLPSWALNDNERDDIMQNSNISDELASKANVSNRPISRELTNNLGLRVTGNTASNLYRGNVDVNEDRSIQDNDRPVSSLSLHQENMEQTGIAKGTVKTMRNKTFARQRQETVSVLAPGVSMFSMKSLDNRIDIIYHIQNENFEPVTITLDFTGSTGIDLLEPTLPSGSMKVCVQVPSNEKIVVAHIQQCSNSACTLRMSCGVSQSSSRGTMPEISGQKREATTRKTRAASIGVGDAEKKQLAPGIFLYKQKISSPLGYQYSFENQKKHDYEFSMDFAGSSNVQVVGTREMKVAVVAAPGETVSVATVTQVDLGVSILVKTKIGVKELRTVSTPKNASVDNFRGPEGSGMMIVVKEYRAANRNEMDVFVGDEVFLQGGNSKGEGWAVGVNARSGATGLCPLECLEVKANSNVQIATSGGGYNNVHRRNSNGGWGRVEVPVNKIGGAEHNKVETGAGSGRRVSVLEAANANNNTYFEAKIPPIPPPKTKHFDVEGVAGAPQPVALSGLGGGTKVGASGTPYVVSQGSRVTYTNERKTTPGMRVDPRSGKVTVVQPGQSVTKWKREEPVVKGL